MAYSLLERMVVTAMSPLNVEQHQVWNYLGALETDEAEIDAAGAQYAVARARLDVALRRYAALREFVTETLGYTPYHHTVAWPDAVAGAEQRRGNYRFAGMGVGDAIIEVFLERFGGAIAPATFAEFDREQFLQATLTLEEITEVLSGGGLGFPEPVTARAVNAALMRTTGLTRYEGPHGEARYGLIERPPVEPDDIPFE